MQRCIVGELLLGTVGCIIPRITLLLAVFSFMSYAAS
jgi:hypothetical protein